MMNSMLYTAKQYSEKWPGIDWARLQTFLYEASDPDDARYRFFRDAIVEINGVLHLDEIPFWASFDEWVVSREFEDENE
jgi:hypothetical protein